MNIGLLQWGLLSFMLGIIISIPVAALHYQSGPNLKIVFTNYRKLLSAHLDFFTQAFALGFVYVLEMALKMDFPLYVDIPLIFGSICNPLILLLEATPLARSILTKLLRATSPTSLIFAWFIIAWLVLPGFMKLLLLTVIVIGGLLILNYTRVGKSS